MAKDMSSGADDSIQSSGQNIESDFLKPFEQLTNAAKDEDKIIITARSHASNAWLKIMETGITDTMKIRFKIISRFISISFC